MSIIKFSSDDVKNGLNVPDISNENDLNTATGITEEVRQLILQFESLRNKYLSEQSELRSNYAEDFVNIIQKLKDLGVDCQQIEEIDLNIVKSAIFNQHSKEN